MARGRGQEGGFSLVEMAVVLVVAGILLAVTTPALRRYVESYRVRNAANQVASDLRLARQKSITNNTQNWFLVASGTNTYWTGIRTKNSDGTWSSTFAWTPWTTPTNTKLVAPNFNGNPWTYYTPDGKAYNAGYVRLTSTVPSVTDTVNVNVELAGAVWQ